MPWVFSNASVRLRLDVAISWTETNNVPKRFHHRGTSVHRDLEVARQVVANNEIGVARDRLTKSFFRRFGVI